MEKDDFLATYKEGDVIVSRNWIFIYARLRVSDFGREIRHAIVYHALVNTRNPYDTITVTRTGIGYIEGEDFKLANNREKKLLFDALEKKHMRWNSETMCLEDTRPIMIIEAERPEMPF
jgi:hypothetical protein